MISLRHHASFAISRSSPHVHIRGGTGFKKRRRWWRQQGGTIKPGHGKPVLRQLLLTIIPFLHAPKVGCYVNSKYVQLTKEAWFSLIFCEAFFANCRSILANIDVYWINNKLFNWHWNCSIFWVLTPRWQVETDRLIVDVRCCDLMHLRPSRERRLRWVETHEEKYEHRNREWGSRF